MNCARCGCPEKKHCKGGARHISYKDEARMNPKPNGWMCSSRHCEATLCSCVDYVAPDNNAVIDAPVRSVVSAAVADMGRAIFARK